MSRSAPRRGAEVDSLEQQIAELRAQNEQLRKELAERERVAAEARKEREILDKIFEHIPVMIAYTGASKRLELVNREFERVMGWSVAEISDGTLDVYTEAYPDPEERARVLGFIAAAEAKWGDFKTRIRGGAVLDTTWARIRLSDGTSLGFGQDITERKTAEDRIRRSEAYLNESQRLSHHGSWAWDVRTCEFTYWSRETYRIFNLDPDSDRLSFEQAQELLHPADRAAFERLLPGIIRDKKDFEIDVRVLLRNRQRKYIRCTGHPILDARGELIEFVGTYVDTTERKRVEKLQRNFSRQLVRAQEAERRHIARELHDEIGQALTALKFDLHSVQQAGGEAAPSLSESMAIADRTLQQVRDLSLDLRPSLLDDFGLYPALRWYLNRHAQRAGLAMHLAGTEFEPRLSVDIETVCFRVAQEALTNVARHAQASNVWVELRRTGRRVTMIIRDDGVGFDTDAARRLALGGKSLGLLGMQERVTLVGGRIKIDSIPGSGTTVEVSLPTGASRRS